MLTELRPKKELLDTNFSGYKLSLDPIPVYHQRINEGVDHVSQSEDQYSFIHTKLFSLHNHLFGDPWHENNVFLIDKTWKIYKATVSSETGRVEGDVLKVMWSIPQLEQRKTGHYNVSLAFPSPDMAVLSDGCGQIHVLNRNGDSHWRSELSSQVMEPDTGSLLVSARPGADTTLHCVLMTLETVTADAEHPVPHSHKPRPATVNTVLHWIILNKDSSGIWSVSCTRKIEGAGSVDYVALEVSCAALYIGGNANFRFTADSANPLPSPTEVDKMDEDGEKPMYTWEQTQDDLRVVVEVGEDVTRDSVEIVVTDKHLTVRCKQLIIVDGDLSHPVDTDLTTWTLQPERLEITLSKRNIGLMWPELIIGDLGGQQIIDPSVVQDVHTRLNHLCSDTEIQEGGEGFAPTFNLDQLEDCDTAPDDPRSLYRLNATTHTISHQISLAGHQWLMSVTPGPDHAPCVCVRHDVDGCVWQLYPPSLPTSTVATEWPSEHIGTFCALGYVAAAKQQKKFIIAAPDLSYAVICEASNHIFVYRKASVVNGELRNRKTSTKVATVAKQQLINLESQAPILGAHATISHLFVLTMDTLYIFHVQ